MAAIMLASCGKFGEITIGAPDEIQVKGFEDNYLILSLSLPINNPTVHKIQLKEIDLRVFINNRYIGKLVVDEKLTIKPKSSSMYFLPVKIRLANLLNTAFIMINLRKGQQVEFRFEGNIIVKTLILTRSIEINELRRITI